MRRAAVLVVLAFAACGGDDGPVASTTPTPTPAATAVGCGKYCQQAGGYGGGEEGKSLMRIKTKGTVAVKDGALPIEVTCLTDDPCRGAVMVSMGDDVGFDKIPRGDLLVDGKTSATILVAMTKSALKALETAGGRMRASIFADYGDPKCPPGSILPCVAFRDVTITSE